VLSGDTKKDDNVIEAATGADLLVHQVAMAAEAIASNPPIQAIMGHHTLPNEAGEVFSAASPGLAVYSHFVLLGPPGAAPTTDDVMALTRTTYDGPVEIGSKELADGYMAATGRPWTQPIGFKHALFEVVADVIARTEDPEDPDSIVAAIASTQLDTIVGPVDWSTGPVRNVSKTPLVAGQWQRGENGLSLEIVANEPAPEIPVTADLQLL
jgi:hypothetical protein